MEKTDNTLEVGGDLFAGASGASKDKAEGGHDTPAEAVLPAASVEARELPKIQAPSIAEPSRLAGAESSKMPPAAQLSSPAHRPSAAAPSSPAERATAVTPPSPAERPAAPSAQWSALKPAVQPVPPPGVKSGTQPAASGKGGAATARAGAMPDPRAAVAAAARAAMARIKDVPRANRFTMLAASVAVAASVGAAIGTIVVAGMAGLAGPALSDRASAYEVRALKEMVTQLGAEAGAIKASLDQSSKTAATQFTRIGDRVERAERQLTESNAKLAKALESLERIERRPAAGAAAAASDTTGSTSSAAAAPPKPPIVKGWVLRRVYDGVALVEGRRGTVEVEPGDRLSGAGRVYEIKRDNGRWVVVTNGGLIVPAR